MAKFFSIFLLTVAGAAPAMVLRVPQDYATIQAAIDAVGAVTDTVVLDTLGAPYTGPQNRDLSFAGKEFVMRCLDPLDPAIRDATVIDAQGADRHFRFDQGEGLSAKLWGLTLRNGLAPDAGAAPSRGGAIICVGASPTIANCRLEMNQAHQGGAVACLNGSAARLVDCIICDNLSVVGPPGSGQGGALFVGNSANPHLNDCELMRNSAAARGGAIQVRQAHGLVLLGSSLHDNSAQAAGGALAVEQSQSIDVNNSAFNANQSGGDGGAVWLNDVGLLSFVRTTVSTNSAAFAGGGLHIGKSGGVVQFCDIHHNQAVLGGGGLAVVKSDVEFARCRAQDNVVTSQQGGRGGGVHVLLGNPTFIACTFERNQARGGGGVALGDSSAVSLRACIIDSNVVAASLAANGDGSGGGVLVENAEATIAHCTIVENQVPVSGGGVYATGSDVELTIENSILFDNWAEQILVATGVDTVTYSDVEGGYPGGGNIDVEVTYEHRVDPIYKYVPDVISAPVDAGLAGSGQDYIDWCGLVDYDIDYWCESDSVMNSCDPDMGAYGGPDGEWWLRDHLPPMPPCS
jgi:hypothetical protein